MIKGLILLGIVTILAVVFLVNNTQDFGNTFEIDATYDGSENVLITFSDKSEKTNYATLQILGMTEPFQKTFDGSSFVEEVTFHTVPKYGWKAHPIIVDIEHTELGHVQLKTEVHHIDEPAPQVIYGQP